MRLPVIPGHDKPGFFLGISRHIPLGLQPVQVLQLKNELIILLQQVKVAPAGTNTNGHVMQQYNRVALWHHQHRHGDSTQDIQFTLIG